MSFVILLDEYQGNDGPDNYSVTFEGTEAACEAQVAHDGRTYPEPKASYTCREIKRTTLYQDGTANGGVIAELTALTDNMSDTVPTSQLQKTAPPKRKRRKPATRKAKPASEIQA